MANSKDLPFPYLSQPTLYVHLKCVYELYFKELYILYYKYCAKVFGIVIFLSTWLDSNQRGAINSQDGFADRCLATRPHVHIFCTPGQNRTDILCSVDTRSNPLSYGGIYFCSPNVIRTHILGIGIPGSSLELWDRCGYVRV